MSERWEPVDILIDDQPVRAPTGARTGGGPSAGNPLFPDRRKARKLSPGPWMAERAERGAHPWRVVDPDDRVVALCRLKGDAEVIEMLPSILTGLERIYKDAHGNTKRELGKLLDLIGWSEEYVV